MFPFITQPEDYSPEPETDPSLARTIRELRQEKIDLESQTVEMRQKLAEIQTSKNAQTGFAPLASIFPMRRDAFGQTKSSSQLLKIYRTDWSSLKDRFNRASDTGYAYELERIIQKKQAQIKILEREQIGLKVNIETNERKWLKIKSEEVYFSSAADMINLLSHVSLLRDQVSALEQAAEQRIHLYLESDESLQRTQSRYRRMVLVARECGVTLRTSTDQSVKNEYGTAKLRLERLGKKVFFKEEQRIKELILEEKRLNGLKRQIEQEIAAKEVQISDQRTLVLSRSARASPKGGRPKLHKDLSQQISLRF